MGDTVSLINLHGENKTVSVVIPTLNEASNSKPNLPAFIGKVVIVDGKSRDGTTEEIKKFRSGAKIIVETPRRKGAAIKTGFQHTTGTEHHSPDVCGGDEIIESNI
jgi:glycosyltransferase involved in cell wall biosynthesis